MRSFLEPMRGARALVQEGRLGEATALIQEALSGARAEAPTDGARPMRDVTPRPNALPSPAEPQRGDPAEADRPSGRRFKAADPAEGAAPRPQTSPAGREPGPTGLRARLREGLARVGRSGGPRGRFIPPAGARWEERRHEGPHGALVYRLYVPASTGPRPPLLVMLHGCTQDPDDFALGTRMNAVAEEVGALIAYPRQEAGANPNRCWNWFEPAHHGRSGEAARIAGIATELVATEGADPVRVFAAGLSAGGAMAAALGAAHPDVFAAVGVHSGLPAGAARDMPGAFAAMGGRGAGPAEPMRVRAIAFHGAADRTVAPVNAERIAMAGRDGATKPRVMRGTENGRAFERVRLPAAGRVGAVELWRVEGLGHAWSGGSAEGSYADPQGPDASRAMMRFFLGDAA